MISPKAALSKYPAFAGLAMTCASCATRRIFYQTFQDDQIVRLFALEKGGEARFDDLEAVAEALSIKVDLRNPANRMAEAARLRRMYGFKSSEYVLDILSAWAEKHHKKLIVPLVLLRSPSDQLLKGGERFDASFIDYLERKKITWFDSSAKTQAGLCRFAITPEKYIDRLLHQAGRRGGLRALQSARQCFLCLRH